MKILLVIDMQRDFIDGALGTKEAAAIVPNVVEKIKNFEGKVFYTRDTHGKNYLDTQEGRKLPVIHCVRGTKGWELHPAIQELNPEDVIDKPTFGSVDLGYALGEYEKDLEVTDDEQIESVTLVGLCTDICVISNAIIMKALFPEIPVIVDASCCAGVTPESHKNALEAMKMCQIEIV